MPNIPKLYEFLNRVEDERKRQDKLWGEQNHPDGTSPGVYGNALADARTNCDVRALRGTVTWTAVLLEEVFEVTTETDPLKLKKELAEVAAVCAAWAEAIDRRETV